MALSKAAHSEHVLWTVFTIPQTLCLPDGISQSQHHITSSHCSWKICGHRVKQCHPALQDIHLAIWNEGLEMLDTHL